VYINWCNVGPSEIVGSAFKICMKMGKIKVETLKLFIIATILHNSYNDYKLKMGLLGILK